MKKIVSFIILIVLCCSIGISNASDFEPRGIAFLPEAIASHYSSTHYYTSQMTITNISGSDVVVRVKYYDHDGDDVTSYATVSSGSSNNNNGIIVATGTGTFNLPAGASRYIGISTSSTARYIHGYATVEWSSSNEHLRKALIAVGSRYTRNGNLTWSSYIPVNNGQPF